MFVDGVRWNARTSGTALQEGEDVVVTEVDGLTLTVKTPEPEGGEADQQA